MKRGTCTVRVGVRPESERVPAMSLSFESTQHDHEAGVQTTGSRRQHIGEIRGPDGKKSEDEQHDEGLAVGHPARVVEQYVVVHEAHRRSASKKQRPDGGGQVALGCQIQAILTNL